MTTIEATAVLPSHLAPAASSALGRELGDSPALAALRASAAKLLTELEAPTRADRPWKYTDPARLHWANYHPRRGTPGTPNASAMMESGTAGVLELVDGLVVRRAATDGLAIGAGSEPGLAELVDHHLGSRVEPATNLFSALHYAFLDGLAVVYAPANLELGLPVRLLRRFGTGGALAAPHTLIVTGANARVSVVEDCRSTDDDMLVLPVVEIVTGEGSEVRYTVLHRWGSATQVISTQRTITAKDAAVTSLAVVTGGALVKSHVTATLEGRGSSSDIFGLFLGDSSEHFDLYTVQDHVAADTRSDLLYKSALRGNARSVYYGLTRVGLEARNADANQENRNLLLGRTAKADSDPVLEIFTNNVIRAAHGATAGPVDESQLFYLEARGLARPAAESLLVSGFLGEVLDRIPDETLRTEVAASIGFESEDVL